MIENVVIDNREQDRINKAGYYYTKEGLNVTVSTLNTGDYLFDDTVVFEYKNWNDYINSIIDGRLFNEAIRQSEHYPHHFVIIDGNDYTLLQALRQHDSITMKHIQGSIARLNTYTTVIRNTGGLNSCFYQMLVQARKCLDNKGKVKHFDAKSGNAAFNALCYCLDDVADTRAKQIVTHLKLQTWSDVYHLTKQDLLKVPGIGDKLSDSIITQINRRG